MRQPFALLVIFGILWAPAAAQSAERSSSPHTEGDFGVGYSYLDLSNNGHSQSFNGADFSLAFNISHWIAGAADFDIAHANVNGVGINARTYTFGPRIFRQKGRFMPFGEFLLGGAPITGVVSAEPISSEHFAINMLGGLDVGLNRGATLAFRPEVSYLHVFSNPTGEGVHIGAGVAYHF